MAKELKPTAIQNYWVIYRKLHDGILSLDSKDVDKLIEITECTNIELPDSVTKIENIKGSTIKRWPKNITEIYKIDSCTNIELPDSVTKINYIVGSTIKKWPKNLIEIKNIENCNNIQIPNTVNAIERVGNCNNITIPDSVSSCSFIHMEDYDIPNFITNLQGIERCKNIRLHSKIQNIGYIVTSIATIPSFVRSIQAVSGDYGILQLSMESSTPPVLGKAVHLSSDDILIVPVGAKEAYANDPKWGKFKNIREDADLGIASNQELQNKAKGTQKEQSVKNEPTTVKKETVKSGPTQDELFALDRLIDAALEDFVVTDEERKILLNKVKAIGMNQDEFTLILNSKIEKRLKEKPFDKPEEKKKGFFARLFGK